MATDENALLRAYGRTAGVARILVATAEELPDGGYRVSALDMGALRGALEKVDAAQDRELPLMSEAWAIDIVQSLNPKLCAGRWRASWTRGDDQIRGFWWVTYSTSRKPHAGEWTVEPVKIGPPLVLEQTMRRRRI
jgi:hypothetical protein